MKHLSTIIIAIVVGFITAYVTVHSFAPNGAATVPKESVYDRVMRTGTIRCGYLIYPGQFDVDPNTGKLTGIMPDILEELGKVMGIEIDYTEEVGAVNMILGLESGRYDMMCTAALMNPSRAKSIRYSAPLYFSPYAVAVRKNDSRFDADVNRINNKDIKISVVEGGTQVLFAKQRFPEATLIENPELTDLSQTITDVKTGKADVTIQMEYAIKDFVHKNPDEIKELILPEPLKVFANSWLYKSDDERFAKLIDTAISHMLYNGDIDRILAKHEQHPGSFLRVIRPYAEMKQ